MEYKYNIFETVYDDMASGKKTIEYRLLNEKSSAIKRGDIINFVVFGNENKYLKTEVVDKYIYENVDDLWNHPEVLTNALDYTKDEFFNVLCNIFGENNVKNSKIVGIKIKVIEKYE